MPAAPVPPDWADLPDERLLDLRLCDLPVRIEGSVLEGRIADLRGELVGRGLDLPLHFYLAEEWFTPDGASAMAVPFYLAHPRLEKLEEAQMLEVEGGDYEWCMRILRHEAGHLVDNMFALRRRRHRREVFGPSSTPYPEFYAPKPYSKSFVLHLDSWYAQSHPAEDFAETFAVWLTPDADWRQRYQEWPALKKLEYMDELMQDIAGREPLVTSRQQFEPLSHLRRTLRSHYRSKREHYGVTRPNFYDRDLRRLFSHAPEFASHPTAAAFLTKIRRDVRRRIAAWSGIHQYTVDQVLEDIIARCRQLKLRVVRPEEQTRLDFTVLLTVQTMNYLHSGRHRVAL
jgi:hypothetical protein